MNIEKRISTVDCHTAGEPTRIVTGGIPHIPGKTMVEKKRWLQDHLDDVRKMLMWEPRGHRDMFGALITAPCQESAHAGVIFMDSKGYLDMCGHGSMAAVMVLVNTGMIPMTDTVHLDTPAGPITARVALENGRVGRVSIQNVPAFHYDSVTVDLPDTGAGSFQVKVDIAYGGNFFGLVDVADLGLPLEIEAIDRLKPMALEIRQRLNDAVRVRHPGTGVDGEVALIELYQNGKEGAPTKNMVVFGNGQVDRSPCGTGTCAKMALLFEKGKLKVGDSYPHLSILDTLFVGKVVDETTVGGRKAIVPEISGEAFITGFHDFVVDPMDPFKAGFQL